jgi:hydroxyethylthiazole kinase-like sugar kinase family protein
MANAITITIDNVYSALEDVRLRRPLVHNITNYVAMTVSANVPLALGTSPAMVHAVEEVEGFVAISDAGSVAAQRCRRPGHLPAEICDALHRIDRAALATHARLSE